MFPQMQNQLQGGFRRPGGVIQEMGQAQPAPSPGGFDPAMLQKGLNAFRQQRPRVAGGAPGSAQPTVKRLQPSPAKRPPVEDTSTFGSYGKGWGG
jgi:hypothetical protein